MQVEHLEIRPNADHEKLFRVCKADGTEVFAINTSTAGATITGTATTTGETALTGGITISEATTNAITITGASSTAQINLAHTFAAVDDRCILITSSSTGTTATSQAPIQMNHTMTGVGAVGGRAEFNTTYNAVGAAGGWTNALKGNFTFGASATGGTGLHSAVCAEITTPNATVTGGHYTCFEAELNLPASHIPQANKLSFIYLSANTTAATMDTYGAVMSINGITAGSGKMFDSTVNLTNPQIDHTLRIDINGTFYYIPLCDNAACN